MAGTVRSHREADVAGRRVLVRVDFNVPLDAGRIRDDTRITSALPTLRSLLERGALLVLVSHLGRPKGKPSADLSLAPVATRLGELLEIDVSLSTEVVGNVSSRMAEALEPGDVLMLENVRFEPGEE
ncbi:MAG: phosphoglycerate kinase, partial [Actinomycetota bacterium]|nr:phosphoglycerate kinase [Actinomycetota bacterium]